MSYTPWDELLELAMRSLEGLEEDWIALKRGGPVGRLEVWELSARLAELEERPETILTQAEQAVCEWGLFPYSNDTVTEADVSYALARTYVLIQSISRRCESGPNQRRRAHRIFRGLRPSLEAVSA